MRKVSFNEEAVAYPKALLNQWENGNYSMLKSSNASEYLKRILVYKAKKRTGTRFFGEAYVVSRLHNNMREGYYNSFKWLTADKWRKGSKLQHPFELPFYEALIRYFGGNLINSLQENSIAYYQKNGRKKPIAPALWIVDKDGNSRFIEVKLPWDTIRIPQLAGLALIKNHLECSVSIISLYAEGKSAPRQKEYTIAV
jgi:hypothetical protein